MTKELKNKAWKILKEIEKLNAELKLKNIINQEQFIELDNFAYNFYKKFIWSLNIKKEK